ncbi:MAG: S53 family peptidase [Streptosporangiaceae bacterium]|nr:S53 family peptidase [Streptosporangiaceae bacterium]
MAPASAVARPAAAARVAVARPFAIRLGNYHWAQPPTTSQCLQTTGYACYRPSQFQEAYDLKPLYASGLNGRGKTIIIVDSFGSPTIKSDLATFDAAFHLPAPPRFTVLQPVGKVPPFDPTNPTMVGWAEETSLDVEYSHAMAPGANIVLLETPVAETEGTVGFPQIIAAENYAIDHHLGDVISQSFGATEETFPSPDSIFDLRSAYFNAAAHNVTVLASSGDQGVSGYHFNGVTLYTYRVVDWPSSDPLVTSVGGLQLHLDAQGNRTLPDNVWNETYLFGTAVASGGGTSAVFSRPGYQNSVAKVVGLRRGTPDISLSAAVNGGALVYMSFAGLPGPAFYIIGGTSEASPELAGIVAIADQAAGHDLGLLNPALYGIGSGGPGIPDITIGNNTVTFTQNGHTYTVRGYNAVPGYDMASGLGTVDAAKLVAELAK